LARQPLFSRLRIRSCRKSKQIVSPKPQGRKETQLRRTPIWISGSTNLFIENATLVGRTPSIGTAHLWTDFSRRGFSADERRCRRGPFRPAEHPVQSWPISSVMTGLGRERQPHYPKPRIWIASQRNRPIFRTRSCRPPVVRTIPASVFSPDGIRTAIATASNYTPCDPRERPCYRSACAMRAIAPARSASCTFSPADRGACALLPASTWSNWTTGISRTDPYSDYVAWRKSERPEGRHSLQYDREKSAGRVESVSGPKIDSRYSPTAWVGDKTRTQHLREFSSSGKPFFLFSLLLQAARAPHRSPALRLDVQRSSDSICRRKWNLKQISALPKPLQSLILRGPSPNNAMNRTQLEWDLSQLLRAASPWWIGRVGSDPGRTRAPPAQRRIRS